MKGMRVIEVASVLAGPSVGQFLRELGAEVIKVESPVTRGDVTRTWRLPVEKDSSSDVTAYFSTCNMGKKSVVLNLAKDEGRQALRDLASMADVFLASFKPGDAEKLGVDWETLCGMNERLIYAQITGYGLHNSRAGYDAVIQAESGFQFMNGPPDGEPCKMPVALMDVIAGHQLKEAVLLQLWRRERTGRGAAVNVSLMSGAITSLSNQAMNYLKAGVVSQRLGSDHPTICPYGTIFETKNAKEQVTFGVGTDGQFKNLCKVLGKPEIAENDKFRTNPGRCANRDELLPLLREIISNWGRKDLLEELYKNAVPSGAINDIKAAFDQPEARELVVTRPASEEEKARFPHLSQFDGNQPYGIRQIAWKGAGPEALNCRQSFSPPPSYGEHTDEVLKSLLGKTDEEIAKIASLD